MANPRAVESPASEGLLLADKPAGMTSHDVVALARRALGERRIGHAGTLDPFATGLLVLLVGRATRLLPYVDGEPKVYEATILFGTEMTTDDATGEPTRAADPPAEAAVDQAMGRLTGAFPQTPPPFSAKLVAGRRAYAAARRGEPLALPPVPVVVHEWRVRRRGASELEVTITCGGGTYVRALARDLGRLAGSAAHLGALRRIRSGPFDVADAVTIEPGVRPTLRPALDALGSPVIEELDDAALRQIVTGRPVPARSPGIRAALVDASRALVAVAEREGDSWRPRVVLRDG
jgi:tRNA pseudouridine55 synthase